MGRCCSSSFSSCSSLNVSFISLLFVLANEGAGGSGGSKQLSLLVILAIVGGAILLLIFVYILMSRNVHFEEVTMDTPPVSQTQIRKTKREWGNGFYPARLVIERNTRSQ